MAYKSTSMFFFSLIPFLGGFIGSSFFHQVGIFQPIENVAISPVSLMIKQITYKWKDSDNNPQHMILIPNQQMEKLLSTSDGLTNFEEGKRLLSSHFDILDYLDNQEVASSVKLTVEYTKQTLLD